jgi:hypothetical protein
LLLPTPEHGTLPTQCLQFAPGWCMLPAAFSLMKFRATVRYWRPDQASGLAVADIPTEHIAPLGGLKQQRVRGTVNGVEYVSNVMPAGSGRLALSVSQKMMRAAGVSVGEDAEFEIERLASPAEGS